VEKGPDVVEGDCIQMRCAQILVDVVSLVSIWRWSRDDPEDAVVIYLPEE